MVVVCIYQLRGSLERGGVEAVALVAALARTARNVGACIRALVVDTAHFAV